MKSYRLFVIILLFCTYFVDAGKSEDDSKCIFGNDAKENARLMDEISFLVGQNFTTTKAGYKYMISICNDISNQNEFASVTQMNYKDFTVVGRRNDSHLIHGDSWMVLSYGSGDFLTDKKETSQRRSASIYIVCCPEEHYEPHIELVEENGEDYKFVLATPSICKHDEEVSGMKIILVLLAIVVPIYCILGIVYNRMFHNAQRCQQIPNFNFWSKVGNTLADGCNYVCRCDSEPENSWNMSSNFENYDRDETLLRP